MLEKWTSKIINIDGIEIKNSPKDIFNYIFMRMKFEFSYLFRLGLPKSAVQSSIKFDKIITVCLLILSIMGLTTLLSAYTLDIYNRENVVLSILPIKFVKQLFFVILSWFIYYIIYKYFNVYYFKHVFILLLLSFLFIITFTAFFGSTSNTSARRWLNLGVIVIQPAELGKILIPFIFAYLLSVSKVIKLGVYFNIFHIFLIAIIGMTILFIFKKMPDTGTTIAYFIIILSMLGFANLSKNIQIFISISFIIGVLSFIIMIIFFPQVITDLVTTSKFQSGRIVTFLNPFNTVRAEGYQVVASVIAIARGSILGTGLGNGTQKLGWLPESDSDFIFSTYTEELGLIGVFATFIVLFVLYVHSFKKIYVIEDRFLKLFAFGLLNGMFANVLINLGGISGAIPLSGVPLPFFSSGVTSLIVTFMSLAIMQVCINTDRIRQTSGQSFDDIDEVVREKRRIKKLEINDKKERQNKRTKIIKVKKGENIKIDKSKYKIKKMKKVK